MRPLDTHDRTLIDLLTRDARLSTAELAGYLGETPENVLDRITTLTTSGHIAGYRAVRGFPDPDRQPITVLMFIERNQALSGKDVLRSLRTLPELVSSDVADTGFDLLLRLRVETEARIAEIEAFFDQQVGVTKVTVVRPVSSVEKH
ncbi:Lrp/AsnC family transcriptional regulator [Leifsonia shinshuensis]|uniref:Lrp/AsnC family transcriptional regulator n=1 Tax=Leifsonia shinshuensis TaxID=150026 RepID=UPI001F50B4F8|nr:Lrp/AsnC family transcriptional regulator [Leifsonia shinshuensis]MCI0156505.1 Lrp/AsnC family transcriptional regulator [Leifsonia shinshuensis]